MFYEDMFIRKFPKGTWSQMFLSEIIMQRQRNTVRIAAIIRPLVTNRKIYFCQ